MKNRIINSMLLVLVSTGTYAKDILHTPIIGEYDKQQTDYISLKNNEDKHFWDLSKIQVLDKFLHVSNEQSPYDENYIIGTEHSTRYSYQSQSNSLLLWGYENHTSTVRYNMPEVIYQENLGTGGHTKGFFHGLEMYCGKLAFRILGSYDFEVVGKGTLILPTGDTLSLRIQQVSAKLLNIFVKYKHFKRGLPNTQQLLKTPAKSSLFSPNSCITQIKVVPLHRQSSPSLLTMLKSCEAFFVYDTSNSFQ